MAYDEYTADRIHRIIKESGQTYYAKKMMGGLVFMVNEKMACGVLYNKKKETDLIMARIGDQPATENMNRPGCMPMDFTGRKMKDFVFIKPEGYDAEEDLEHWINLCLAFNPFAKMSKKRQKK